ncbi:hypothetical protein ACI78Q_18110 [Geodermatophilus sp. SYSU D00705]
MARTCAPSPTSWRTTAGAVPFDDMGPGWRDVVLPRLAAVVGEPA